MVSKKIILGSLSAVVASTILVGCGSDGGGSAPAPFEGGDYSAKVDGKYVSLVESNVAGDGKQVAFTIYNTSDITGNPRTLSGFVVINTNPDYKTDISDCNKGLAVGKTCQLLVSTTGTAADTAELDVVLGKQTANDLQYKLTTVTPKFTLFNQPGDTLVKVTNNSDKAVRYKSITSNDAKVYDAACLYLKPHASCNLSVDAAKNITLSFNSDKSVTKETTYNKATYSFGDISL